MSKINRFDLLRLLFAATVFVFHLYVLSGNAADNLYASVSTFFVKISIQGFFVISGMLVYGSLMQSRDLAHYGQKRIRRLYPAYFVVIAVPALLSFAFGGAVSDVSRYVAANLVFLNFLEPRLPGFFTENRFSEVNGALWTLKIEVMFYLLLPVLAWVVNAAVRAKWVVFVLIYLAAESWRYGVAELDIPYAAQIARQLPGQMSFFITGMMLWTLREKL